ncbi:VOC family protein [Flavobacterium sp.]|uniref:VOC family protein n=1 Tax=Flavobacterium sp. TaxID=239 RepID=UPI002FDE3275
MKFHHVGVACRNIETEIESISRIHQVIHVSDIVFDSEQKAQLCMITTAEGVNIELVSGEQVENLIKKRIAYYHLCFETNDLIAEINRLQELGAFLVSEAKPALLFNHRKVAFLQASYGLIELVEANPTGDDF